MDIGGQLVGTCLPLWHPEFWGPHLYLLSYPTSSRRWVLGNKSGNALDSAECHAWVKEEAGQWWLCICVSVLLLLTHSGPQSPTLSSQTQSLQMPRFGGTYKKRDYLASETTSWWCSGEGCSRNGCPSRGWSPLQQLLIRPGSLSFTALRQREPLHLPLPPAFSTTFCQAAPRGDLSWLLEQKFTAIIFLKEWMKTWATTLWT